MIWLPLTLLCAFCLATGDALSKRALERHDEYLFLWVRLLLAMPLLMGGLFFAPLEAPAPEFYPAVLLALPLEAAAAVLYIRALKLSPLSLVLPLLALTPLFLLAVPALVLGERLSGPGACGVLLIAAGVYVLNLDASKRGILAPFRALMRDSGARCMLAVAFLYSITSTLGKQAIAASSPLFFAGTYFPALLLVLTLLLFRRSTKEALIRNRGELLRASLGPAVFYGLMILSHMVAVSLTQVAYMISVKRLSLLMGVFYGYRMFGEKQAGSRAAGALLMLAGLGLISLFP